MSQNQRRPHCDQSGSRVSAGRQRFQSLALALSRMNSARNREQILATMNSEANVLAATDGVCVIAKDGEQLYLASGQRLGPASVTNQRFPLLSALAKRSMNSGTTIVVRDVSRDRDFSALQSTAIGSLIMVPVGEPAPRAAIAAYWASPHHPRPEEVAVLETLIRAAWDAVQRRQTEERLRQSEERLSAIFKHAAVGLSELSLDGKFLRVNDELCRILGRPRERVLQLGIADVTHPGDIQRSLETVQRLIATGKPGSLDKRYQRPDGSLVWATSSVTRLDDEHGRPSRVLAVTVDLTQRKLAEDALRASERRYRALAELSPEGILVAHNGIYQYANAAAMQLLRAGESDIVGHPTLEFVTSNSRRAAHEQLSGLGTERPSTSLVEQRWRRKDGKEIDLEVSVGRIEWEGQPAVQILLRDITERKQAEVRIWRHANFDALTGLPNRRLFRDRLDQEIKKAQRLGHQLALLFIDLDGFKQVNDLLGHDAGDQLLIQAAQRLEATVRRGDTVARLGGDEFTVILSELQNIEPVEQVAQKIIDTLAKPFRLGKETTYVSASLGITIYPNDATTSERLIRAADQAMYSAKQAGKNRFSYFTREMDRQAHRRLRMINELRIAVGRGQLEVYYQPVIDLATANIVKAEALVRWHHPRFGLVMPSTFVPLAEESGLIRDIGNWVFREAARFAKHCRARSDIPLQVTVNKSPAQFLPATTENEWLHFLHELNLAGDSITVEITENVLLDASSTVTDRLRKLHDAGVEVAIDDFGTGYSSLAYLKKFDIDYLKIDQSFVRDMALDNTNRTIAETIIVMAHKLGLKVIAEGIETPAQLALLKGAGCDFGQGFLFSRPLPAAQFDRLLAAGHA